MARIRIAAMLLAVTVVATPANAQFERYELGRRLREFEYTWDKVKDQAARAEASRSLNKAVTSFFSAKQGQAARFVTEAGFALRGETRPTADELWAASLSANLDRRLLDTSAESLKITLAPFYDVEGPKPQGLRMRIELGKASTEDALGDLPLTIVFPTKGIAPGDHPLRVQLVRDGKLLAESTQVVSFVDRLDARVSALKAITRSWSKAAEAASIDRESVATDLATLTALASGKTLESDVKAAELLEDLERHAEAASANRPYLGKDRPGQAMVTIPAKGGRTLHTRVFIPESAKKGEPIPLVVALHGAGGSENMFFESYGHGRIVDLCRERGWMLVAPRGGFGGSPVREIVDGLATIYPIDRKRVMLIGHSMGAAGAVGAAQVDPSRYIAVAALGGGGSVRPTEGLNRLPFFVGVGSEDFALRGSRGLVASLKRANVQNLDAREYPQVEHLAIVQVALDDVFAFFEKYAR